MSVHELVLHSWSEMEIERAKQAFIRCNPSQSYVDRYVQVACQDPDSIGYYVLVQLTEEGELADRIRCGIAHSMQVLQDVQ